MVHLNLFFNKYLKNFKSQNLGLRIFVYRFFLFVCFSIILESPSLANTESSNSNPGSTFYFRDPKSTQTTYFAVIDPSQGLWRVQFFKKAKNQFQEKIWSRSWSSRQKGVADLKAWTKNKFVNVANLNQNELAPLAAVASSWITEVPGEQLWQDTETWTWDWEIKYSQWIKANVGKDFLTKLNLESDCADLAYIVRWVFARIHKLPAANRLAGTKDFLTNRSMKKDWMKFPSDPDWKKDQRFFQALTFLTANTYTHSLWEDSYPIAITPESLLAGTHHLSLHKDSGHTMLVFRAGEKNHMPVEVYYSSTPRVVRELYQAIYFEPQQPKPDSGGFLKMRWAAYTQSGVSLAEKKLMPFFSEEQFSAPFMDKETMFAKAVFKRLDANFSLAGLVQQVILDLRSMLEQRVQVVQSGWAICQAQNCAEGTQNFEDWSTPSRDARVLAIAQSLWGILSQLQWQAPQEYKTLKAKWQTEMTLPFLNIFENQYSLAQILFTWEVSAHDTNPSSPEAKRWGLEPKSFLKSAVANLENLFSERQKKISNVPPDCQQADASSKCGAGTKLWQTWNTHDIDQKISLITTRLKIFCTYFPGDHCLVWDQDLSVQTVFHKTLAFWIENSIWLNSDPTATPNERWGENKSLYDVLEVQGKGPYTINKAKTQIFVDDEENPYLMEVATGKNLQAEPQFRFGGFQPEPSFLYSYSRSIDQFQFHFFDSSFHQIGALNTTKNPNSALVMHWTRVPGLFLLHQESTITLVDILNNSIVEGEFISESSKRETYLFRRKNDSKNKLVVADLSQPNATYNSILVSDQSLEDFLPRFEISFQNQNHLVLRFDCVNGPSKCKRAVSYFSFDLKTGKQTIWKSATDQIPKDLVMIFPDQFALTRNLQDQIELSRMIAGTTDLELVRTFALVATPEQTDINFPSFYLSAPLINAKASYHIYGGSGKFQDFEWSAFDLYPFHEFSGKKSSDGKTNTFVHLPTQKVIFEYPGYIYFAERPELSFNKLILQAVGDGFHRQVVQKIDLTDPSSWSPRPQITGLASTWFDNLDFFSSDVSNDQVITKEKWTQANDGVVLTPNTGWNSTAIGDLSPRPIRKFILFPK